MSAVLRGSGLRRCVVLTLWVAVFMAMTVAVAGAAGSAELVSGWVYVNDAAAPGLETPVPFAAVTLEYFDGEGGSETVGTEFADSYGRYCFYDYGSFGAGAFELSVNAAGFVSSGQQPFNWDGGEGFEQNFYLDPMKLLAHGFVRTSGTAAGIEQVKVEAWSVVDGAQDMYYGEALSVADGVYEVYCHPWESAADIRLIFTKPGSFRKGVHEEYWNGADPIAADMLLDGAFPIASGWVKEAGTESPIASATVSATYFVYVDEFDHYWEWTGSAETDANGDYWVYDLSDHGPDAYRIEVDTGGEYGSGLHDVEWDGVGTNAGVNFSLGKIRPIASGYVESAQTTQPLGSVWIEAYRYNDAMDDWQWAGEDCTDSDGTYTVNDTEFLGAGQYKVIASNHGYAKGVRQIEWDGLNAEPDIDFSLVPLKVIATGTVSDAVTLQTMSGISVQAEYLVMDGDGPSWLWAGSGTTNEEGVYVVMDEEVHGPDEYRVGAGASGYATKYDHRFWDGGDSLDINLALDPLVAIATGKVTHAGSGDPFEDAYVQAAFWRVDHDDSWWEWAGSTWTGENGDYTVLDEEQHGADEYRILAESTGYKKASTTVTWGGALTLQDVDFALEPLPIIATGTVTDAGSGNPIDGANVTATRWNPSWEDWEWLSSTNADENGEYLVFDEEERGAGSYQFEAQSTGYARRAVARSWNGSTTLTNVDFALPQLAVLATGRVTEEGSESPIEDAHVYSEVWNADYDDWEWAGSTYANSEGYYTLYDDSEIGAGERRISARSDNHVRRDRQEQWDGSTPFENMDFVLPRMKALAQGLVRDAGTLDPIADAWIDALWWDVGAEKWRYAGGRSTDEDGFYAVRDENGYGAGLYRFEARAGGYAMQRCERAWDDADAMENVDFDLEKAKPIATGVVTDAKTLQPLEYADVEASWFDAGAEDTSAVWLWAGYTFTDENGRYTVKDTESRGTGGYRLIVHRWQYKRGERPIGNWNGVDAIENDDTNIALAPDVPAETRFAVTSSSATLSKYGASYYFRGSLVDSETGDPLAGKQVRIQSSKSKSGFTNTSFAATTAANGTFSIKVTPRNLTYYRAFFQGDGEEFADANSSYRSVKPRALVGTPVAPKTMYRYRAKTIYGSLKPRHTSGTYPVKLQIQRKKGTKWVKHATVKAKVSNYSSFSRYKRSIKFTSAGKYRIRATHATDTLHGSHTSSWRYVTVR